VPEQGGKKLVLILSAGEKSKQYEILLEKVRQGQEKTDKFRICWKSNCILETLRFKKKPCGRSFIS